MNLPLLKTVVYIIARVVLAVVVVDLFIRDLKLGVLTLSDSVNFILISIYLHVIALHGSQILAFSERSPQLFFRSIFIVM